MGPALCCAALFDGDRDLLRHDRGIMRYVIGVAHQELERVLARRQVDIGFRLAIAEMKMVLVVGNGLVERRQFGVDKQVMVPGIRFLDASRSNAEIPRAEPHLEVPPVQYFATVGPTDVAIGISRGRRALARAARRRCRMRLRRGLRDHQGSGRGVLPGRNGLGKSGAARRRGDKRGKSEAADDAHGTSPFWIRPHHCGTVTVIFFDMTGGLCGTWSASPSSNCNVCRPGGNSIRTSVCPAPKCK